LTAGALYLGIFWLWGAMYYVIVRTRPGCIYGAVTLVESWTLSVVTQQTVGYGNTGPQRCWASTWVVVCQGITSTILSSIVVGIFFARVSQPMQRARSMYMSEQSVIARRDGALKFMFRVADVRDTQVVEPHLKAFLYTWGPGRVTAEGEKILVRCEALGIGYVDGMLLLPLTVEHLIDERSPLCGHTRSSLVALDAEIVVTLEGTTEFGNPFMARRSYLATEILWGEEFADILELPEAFGAEYDRAKGLSFRRLFRRSLDARTRGMSRLPSHSPGAAPHVALSPSELPSGGSAPAPFALRNRPPPDAAGPCRIRTRVNLQGFHVSQLQRDLPRRAPDEVADLVVSQALESVPYPLLNENTLCLSQWLP
ncbi:inward potassium channel rectifier, partial [Helicosporidium sp. ATCC 50920]